MGQKKEIAILTSIMFCNFFLIFLMFDDFFLDLLIPKNHWSIKDKEITNVVLYFFTYAFPVVVVWISANTTTQRLIHFFYLGFLATQIPLSIIISQLLINGLITISTSGIIHLAAAAIYTIAFTIFARTKFLKN